MAKLLSARQLNLSPTEYAALIKVRDLLREESIEHQRSTGNYSHVRADEQTHAPKFNMAEAAATYDCGSVCCIGGNMRLIELGVDFSQPLIRLTAEQMGQATRFVMKFKPDYLTEPTPLYGRNRLAALFYPREIGRSHGADNIEGWEVITPAAAADAIQNYLTTGDPDWEVVAHQHQLPLNHDFVSRKAELEV